MMIFSGVWVLYVFDVVSMQCKLSVIVVFIGFVVVSVYCTRIFCVMNLIYQCLLSLAS